MHGLQLRVTHQSSEVQALKARHIRGPPYRVTEEAAT